MAEQHRQTHLLATFQPLHPCVDNSLIRLLSALLIGIIFNYLQLLEVLVEVIFGAYKEPRAPIEGVFRAVQRSLDHQ